MAGAAAFGSLNVLEKQQTPKKTPQNKKTKQKTKQTKFLYNHQADSSHVNTHCHISFFHNS